ncbi:Thiol-disulfide oxidoreductase ResA [compost metagenome]
MLMKCPLIHNTIPVVKWSICLLLISISAVAFSRPVDAHLASLAEQSFSAVMSDEDSLDRSNSKDTSPAIEFSEGQYAARTEEGRTGLKGESLQVLASAAPTTSFGLVDQQSYVPVVRGEDGFVLQPGQKAPSFQLEGLNGSRYSLADKPAKPVLINFWASWCDPCRLEAPILNHLYDQYQSKLDIFGVNATKYDRQKDVKQFVASMGLKYPILMDQRGEVFNVYKGMAFPMSVLVGTDGRIKEVMLGMFHEDELEARILKVLDAEKQDNTLTR